MSGSKSSEDKANLPPHPPVRAKAGPRRELKTVPAGKCVADKTESRPKKRASRSGTLPVPPEDRTLDYAASRDELKGIEPGEVVLAVEELEGFKTVIRPALAAADDRRLSLRPGETKRRGRSPSFHALDYWRLEMLRRVITSHSTQDTRNWLTTDKARRTRDLLGFDQPRTHYGGKARRWMASVPSDRWMSDFRTKWLPKAELASLMEQLERWALAEKMKMLPGMREECRTLHTDGSKIETHATAPILKKDKDGNVIEVVNEWKKGRNGEQVPGITAPEAGYIPNKGGSTDHSGHGWNVIFVMTSKGTVLAHRNVPLNAPENETLAAMVPEVGHVLDTLRKPEDGEASETLCTPELRVLSTDAAFHSHATRKALREIGVIENTHLSSHGSNETSVSKAEERTVKRFQIHGYPRWFATGHRELVCACGSVKTSRVAEIDKKTGKATARVKGECPECGNVLIASGLWRLAGNKKFVKCLPHEHDEAEFDFGNPLTFNDALAADYGRRRSNGQEGTFGSQFTQRFNLLRGKRWFYRQSQVNLEVAAVVTITHALSLERWRRMNDGTEATARPLAA